jgi:anti-anti-sigma factor
LAAALGGDMQFASRRLVDVFVAAPTGRVDHPNAQQLQHALAPILDEAVREHAALVLDFSRVEYISSMGLRVLMMAARQLRAADARIAVAALQPVAKEIFDIARFNHVVEIFPDVRAALQQLSVAALAAYDGAAV